MFPFWEVAIEPILRAVKANRIVEIGALAGEHTELLLDTLGPDAELHVIDPLPQFDPDEHRERFGGRYVFHRDISHNVLPTLPPMDAALVDGDHNWYTVYNELRQLAEVSDAAGAPLPVLLLHDTYWPYGRRDLYYDPDQIPAEHRQPYAYKGMRPGRRKLVPRGGLNPRMANAEIEGGPRNGVMTGLEDFLAELDRPVRRLDIPIYFGLSLVIEESLLETNRELQAVLEHLQGAEGRAELLELAEEVRIKAMLYQHQVVFGQEEKDRRAADRYLGVVRGALLNEHYLEHELRLDYLESRIETGLATDEAYLRDPARHLQGKKRALIAARRSGAARDRKSRSGWYPFAPSAIALDRLRSALDSLDETRARGDLVDVGVGRGGASIFMRAYLEALEKRTATVWVVDAFRADAEHGDGHGPDLNTVRDVFARFDLLDDQVKFCQGDPVASLLDAEIEAVALARIAITDAGTVSAIMPEMVNRLSVGGVVVAEPASADPAREVLEEASHLGKVDVDDQNGLVWRKTADGRIDSPSAALVDAHHRVPLVPAVKDGAIDLSIVVVLYNMAREAQRSLHSMSREYQLDVDDLDYEVLVVDNGSAPDQRLSDAQVRAFGPEFRLIEMGDSATTSPVPALIEATKRSRGEALALMIDGAHVLTPRVLANGMRGLSTYGPAIVMTQQWYVGPGQQNDLMLEGYDEGYEDELFSRISWPSDGYRLFEIGSFVGDRDWFDGMWESNCIFAPRSLVEQVGGFDESFDEPGGGYANLELYERLGSHPDTTVVSILGEGSFHQTHGGTTTNQAEIMERGRRLTSYRDRYAEMRGRPFKGPGKPIHYVGNLYGAARRTKARRLTSPLFAEARAAASTETLPIPDELRTGFIEAQWNSEGWRSSSWRGSEVARNPADLWIYQEIVSAVRPERILDVRHQREEPGLAHYLAAVCDSIEHGRVVSIGTTDFSTGDDDRIDWLVRSCRSYEPAAVDAVHEVVRDAPTLVVIGRGRRHEMLQAFAAYQGLVPVGSYVIVEDTVLNGNPVDPEFGPGPMEAVKAMLRTNGDFLADPKMERFGATFNPGGFLLRRADSTR